MISLQNTSHAHRKFGGLRVGFAATLLATLLLFSMAVPFLASATAASGTGTLTKTGSGLVHQDSLTSGTPGCTGGYNDTSSISNYWFVFGDAMHETPSSWTACVGPLGLWLGVQLGNQSQGWAGIYAESPDETVMLYHADLILPAYTISSINSNAFNTGLYVQTYNGMVNYVTCAGQVSAGLGYYWGVLLATGNTNGATTYQQLWNSPTYDNKGPSSEDCTIVTNGSSLLQVYMNSTLVYSDTNDTLNMPEPFNAYLEVESSDAAQMLWASYKDYYSATSNVVTIANVPAGDMAEIVSGSTVYASANNTGTSAATLSLDIAKYDLPLAGSLEVLSGTNVIASTGTGDIWAGDSYSYAPGTTTTTTSQTTTTSTSTTSSLHVDSVNTFGETVDGYYTDLYNSGGSSIATGFTPAVFTLTNGLGYQIEADSYGSCTFSHWSGGGLTGSTADPAPITIESLTTVTAVYSGTSCGPQTTNSTTTSSTTSATTTSITTTTTITTSTSSTSSGGTSALHIDSTNSFGDTVDGYYTDLYNSGGSSIATGFTPSVFTLNDGVGYQIEADSYGSCTFSHWSGSPVNGNTADPVPITISNPTTITAIYTGSSCGPQTTNSTSTTSTSTTSTTSTTTTITTSTSSTSTSSSTSSSSSSSTSSTSSTSSSTSTTSSTSSSSSTTTSTSTTQTESDTYFQATFTQVNTCPSGTSEAGQWLIPWEVTLSGGESASQPPGEVNQAENGSLGYAGSSNSTYSTITFTLLFGEYSFSVQPSSELKPASSTNSFMPSGVGQNITETIYFTPASCGSTTTTTTSTTPTTTTTSTTTTTTSSSGPPSVTVESVNQNGQTITGYTATLLSSTGRHIASGTTTKTFTDVIAGTKYEMELSSSRSCTFKGWQGTTNSGTLSFTQPSGPLTIVGVYNCTSSGSAGGAAIGPMLSSIATQIGIPIAFVIVATLGYGAARGIVFARRRTVVSGRA